MNSTNIKVRQCGSDLCCRFIICWDEDRFKIDYRGEFVDGVTLLLFPLFFVFLWTDLRRTQRKWSETDQPFDGKCNIFGFRVVRLNSPNFSPSPFKLIIKKLHELPTIAVIRKYNCGSVNPQNFFGK